MLTSAGSNELIFSSSSAGAPLPDNWDKVRLDRKAILKLEAAGVQHAQTPVRHRASAVMDE